jgi:hypothetical protein
LNLFSMEMHSSGNPMPWDVEAGPAFTEYVSMLHVKKVDYTHWAVRIDRATLQVCSTSPHYFIAADANPVALWQ